MVLAKGEYVTSVTFAEAQYSGHTRIFYAGFTTNYGRTLSGGSKTSDGVTYTAPQGWQIVGFHGRSGDGLNKAGVISLQSASRLAVLESGCEGLHGLVAADR